jgi:MinD superfamily P-loop ATPase
VEKLGMIGGKDGTGKTTVLGPSGGLAHSKVPAAADASRKLVAEIRELARRVAAQREADLVLTDGPPAIAGTVIASLSGVDVPLAVTEPTPSGLHDLECLLQVAARFRVATAAGVRKWDIDPSAANRTESLA